MIRQLLLGRVVTDPDPRGLRLRGARIQGVLDLEQLVTDVSLELADCLIEDGIRAHDARLRGLWLHRCRVNSVAAGDLFLNDGFTARGAGDHAVGLAGAVIGGVLDCSDAQLINTDGAALSADRLNTLAAVRLDRLSAVGAVRLSDTRFGGRLACQAASVSDSNVWVPESRRMSCDLLILVENSAEAVAPSDLVDLGWRAKGEWS